MLTRCIQVRVVENIAAGTTVVRVAAHDRDIGDNAAVSYFLGASSQSVYGDVFSVDEQTGDVVVTGEVSIRLSSTSRKIRPSSGLYIRTRAVLLNV